LRDRRGEVADFKIVVEEDGRDLGALKQVAEVGVDAIDLFDLVGELAVDRLQFLV
jgi:hypothetical protein